MTYKTALAYLASLNESRIRPGLDRIEKALLFFGSPHLKFPHVLVGGTNGKGSVVAMMGSVLEKAGFRVGRYTSPHLHMFEERIVVNGDQLTANQLENLFNIVKDSNIDLSYFEFATVMALLHFETASVDIALLEVGLGGRWDATNATDPLLSVITGIDLDHQGWLGDSVEKIALEKSMIMRPRRPVVINGVGHKALEIMLDHSSSLDSRVVMGGRDFSSGWEVPAGTMYFSGVEWEMHGLRLGLKGCFQRENAATSLAALECLDRMDFIVPERAVAQGLADARWPGRFDDMGGDPKIIVDSAHNPAGAKSLVRSLDSGREIVWLFSGLKDKDLKGIAEELLTTGKRFVLVSLDHPRACSLDDLVMRMPDGAKVIKALTVKEGLWKAVGEAGKGGTVVAVGSIFLAAAVIQEVREKNTEYRTRNSEIKDRWFETRNTKHDKGNLG